MRKSLVSVAALTAIAFVALAGPANAASTASDCLSIQTATLSNGLSFDVQNACDKRLSCALTWTLTCENASGKSTSKTKQEARFLVGASDSHQATGSAATCKDSWKIDDVSWECAPLAK